MPRHLTPPRSHEGVKKDGAGRGNWGKEVENPECVALSARRRRRRHANPTL